MSFNKQQKQLITTIDKNTFFQETMISRINTSTDNKNIETGCTSAKRGQQRSFTLSPRSPRSPTQQQEAQQINEIVLDMRRLDRDIKQRDVKLQEIRQQRLELEERLHASQAAQNQTRTAMKEQRQQIRDQRREMDNKRQQITDAKQQYLDSLFELEEKQDVLVTCLEHALNAIDLSKMSLGDLQRMTLVFIAQMQRLNDQRTNLQQQKQQQQHEEGTQQEEPSLA